MSTKQCEEKLKDKGVRPTAARILILQKLSEQTDLLLNSSESYINISIFVYAMFFAAKTNGNSHLNSLILDKIILPDTETDFEK